MPAEPGGHRAGDPLAASPSAEDAENERLRAENEQLRADVAELQADVASLAAENAALKDKLARLERLISRNSGNSSPHFPAGACACGANLAGGQDLGVRYSHQVTDLPADIRARTVQHDRHAVRCACGHEHVADAPDGAGQPGIVSYGLSFQAWAVFLIVMHHVPAGRCANILESMSGTRPSDGWVHTLLSRAAAAVAAANKVIRGLILLARVICGDETPSGPGPARRRRRSTCMSRARPC